MKRFFSDLFSNQIFRFILTGGISTAIDFAVYMLLSIKLPVEISKGISMLTASVFSYIANKNYTFRNKDRTTPGYLIRFYLVFAANLAVNIFVNSVMLRWTGYKIVSFIAATLAGMTVNYLGQRFIVFPEKRGGGKKRDR